MFSVLVAEAARSRRSDAWLLGWCLMALAVVSVAWIALVGALFAAAVAAGVPWLSAAAALAAVNALGGVLAARIGMRHARNLLRNEAAPRPGVRRIA